ncbi:MAG: hypothetical protein R8P61_20670 [Bacteroidia bacterium]|nr:hypothetical protein [Bacteroidia bacterium]
MNQSDIIAARPIANKALELIRNAQFDSLKKQLDPQFLSQYKPEKLDTILQEAKVILDSSIYPKESEIIITNSYLQTESGEKEGILFGFPFEQMGEENSRSIFQIIVIREKIHGLGVLTFPSDLALIDPPQAEPHRTNFDLQTKDLSWFRIWYDGGMWDNKKYENREGYYAVSGSRRELINTGIDTKFQEVFDLLNKADFDSLDVRQVSDNQIGDPEWIYLRMKFEGENEDLKGLELSYFIKEEKGKEQSSSGYIILAHNYYTRYLLRAEKNPELVRLLTEIGRHDYTGYFESD